MSIKLRHINNNQTYIQKSSRRENYVKVGLKFNVNLTWRRERAYNKCFKTFL